MLAYHRNYGAWFANDVLRAIGTYGMIPDGGRVCVALSGGKDSAVLLFILAYLRRNSALRFELSAMHVRTAAYDTSALRGWCKDLGAAYYETRLRIPAVRSFKSVCAACARTRRGAMARALRRKGITTAAYGHHAGDAAETLIMNMIHSRKLGSFSPVVEVAASPVRIIRPMIYLDERTVARIHRHARLPLLDYRCPYAPANARAKAKLVIAGWEKTLGIPDIPARIVASLENADWGNVWMGGRNAEFRIQNREENGFGGKRGMYRRE